MRAFRLGARAVLDDGLVALPEALASVEEVVRTGGERLLVLRVADGLSVDVRPDRGLDLGAAWWRGIPVAWRSPHRVDPGPGHGWEERFLGGLVVTCGPENIGPPTAAGGQHGSHHLTPATEVRWWRETTPDGIEVHVRGVIGHSTLYGTRVVVEREIVVGTGRARVEIRDEVRNDGDEPVGAPLLYHVNLGAPLLVPGSRLELRGGGAGGGAGSSAAEVDGDVDGEVDVVGPVRSRVREPLPEGREPLVMPAPGPGVEAVAVVAEHRGVAVEHGWSRAVLVGPADPGRTTGTGDGPVGPRVLVEWTGETLPRLCTWAWPARGAWVLGVEPTNAPLFGPERDAPHAGAPLLAPGGRRRTAVAIEIVD